MQGDKEEASRVIFMGWPGQHELEDDRAAHRSQHADGVTGSGGLQTAPQSSKHHALSIFSLLYHERAPVQVIQFHTRHTYIVNAQVPHNIGNLSRATLTSPKIKSTRAMPGPRLLGIPLMG